MGAADDLRGDFQAAMAGASTALAAADRLCLACVTLLHVDGAAVSVSEGTDSTYGTFGSSDELSRRLDEYQFTFGEGPCLDAVRLDEPVLVADLDDSAEVRWSAFREATLGEGVRAVFAFPVSLDAAPVGALDLYCQAPGPLTGDRLAGGLLAARLATDPLVALLRSDSWTDGELAEPEGQPRWTQLASLQRVEVYQATGMIVGAFDVDPAEALVLLRAQAYIRGVMASELALDVVERRVLLDDAWRDGADRQEGGGGE
ncbi:MAG TPA: GAF and ANTAR domain-containing protein [Lapillicoccus sp.]|nr:GAF and ANTAR domain-containing protein [Lapillicoccus sp.]